MQNLPKLSTRVKRQRSNSAGKLPHEIKKSNPLYFQFRAENEALNKFSYYHLIKTDKDEEEGEGDGH